MPNIGVSRCGKQIDMRLVIDGPGVPRRAGARGHAGNDGVEPLAPKSVTGKSRGIVHVDDADLGSIDTRRGRGPRADEANHVVPVPN